MQQMCQIHYRIFFSILCFKFLCDIFTAGDVAESGSWFESSGSKSGGMICANCKTFRCAAGAATSGEPPPFMFRPVKEEDQAAVSVDNSEPIVILDTEFSSQFLDLE